MKRSLLVLLAFLIIVGSAFADSMTVKALGPMPAANRSTSPGVFLFSVNGNLTVGFPDHTPGKPIAGQSWTARGLPFADFSQGTFGSDSDAMEDYEAAAWLILQEPKGGSGGTLDIQMAILALFEPSIEQTKPWNAGAGMWLSMAEGNSYNLGEFSGFRILVPTACMTPACTPLELLLPPGSPDPAPTPEPASVALFGLGLLALGNMLRKRIR